MVSWLLIWNVTAPLTSLCFSFIKLYILQTNSQDTNQDYSATALSFCIANAAKKLGNRFGRSLNGRLTKGDVLPVIQTEKVPVDVERERMIVLFSDCKNETELKEYQTMSKPRYKKEYEAALKFLKNKKHDWLE